MSFDSRCVIGVLFASCLVVACASTPPDAPLPYAPPIAETHPLATSPPPPADPPPPDPAPAPTPSSPPDVATSDPPPPSPPLAPPPPPSSDPAVASAVNATCPRSATGAPPSWLSSGAAAAWSRPARPIALLVTEIQQLEMLKQATPVTAPDRPMLDLRLAHDYFELEAVAYRECSERATTTTMVQQRFKTAKAAHAAAIRQCVELATDFANFPLLSRCPTR